MQFLHLVEAVNGLTIETITAHSSWESKKFCPKYPFKTKSGNSYTMDAEYPHHSVKPNVDFFLPENGRRMVSYFSFNL